ncbi:hypothetical protein C2845_PM13G07010 [Panicum miliaceum]|uniref:BTB/POZ and MATH domain-containing protein 2-like n=1 Tax=Panicum miliaceum TaxID=4540 RepID=A0A3L6RNN2_PANMI|nr:hypothetical protein C2845_PM13G07010 [Panicum miliaceum]
MAAAPEWRPMTRTSSTYIAETARGTHSFKVTMKRGAAAVGACVSSDTFAVGGHDWRIRCYPQGYDAGSKTHVSVFLDLVMSEGGVEVEAQVLVLCDFSLLNRDTEVFSSVLSVERLSKPSKGPWGSHWFMKRSLLGAYSYLKDGCIVIGCDITVVIRQSLVEETVEVQVPPSDMSNDLGRVLESGGSGRDIRARSPVFKELINGSMRDNETMSITVEDVEPDVFKALLHFIYTDALPAMDDPDGERMKKKRKGGRWCGSGVAGALLTDIAEGAARAVASEEEPEEAKKKRKEDFDAFTSTKAQDLAQPFVVAQTPFKIHIVKDHDMKERLCLKAKRLGLSALIMGSRGFGASRRSMDAIQEDPGGFKFRYAGNLFEIGSSWDNDETRIDTELIITLDNCVAISNVTS